MGLGTAATMMPIVGWGDGGGGLAHGPQSSGFLPCPSPGEGEWSFCSCCFLWIFLWSCCLASTEGEEMLVPCGRKEWASLAGTNAETDCGGLFSKKNKMEKQKQGYYRLRRSSVYIHIKQFQQVLECVLNNAVLEISLWCHKVHWYPSQVSDITPSQNSVLPSEMKLHVIWSQTWGKSIKTSVLVGIRKYDSGQIAIFQIAVFLSLILCQIN